jgi:hypothetical protein
MNGAYFLVRFALLIVLVSESFFCFANPRLLSDTLTYSNSNLFESDEILELTLSGQMRKPLHDQSEKPNYYPITISYSQKGDSLKTFPIEIKARGNFRRLIGNCTYAPLMLKFGDQSATEASIFEGQKELKLVMPCKGDEYVVREWLVYKLYNLITPLSFKARLVKVYLKEENRKKENDPFYGILLENEDQMAARNGGSILKRNLKPYRTQEKEFITMAVFEYMIGNTDWSVDYRQNIKLVSEGNTKLPYAVPYDFDHAGIVSAPYANPPQQLMLKSVRERRFRGYCIQDSNKFKPVISKFQELQKQIFALYLESLLLDKKYIQDTEAYLSEFFATIGNEVEWEREFSYPCDPNGTGNVVIKGLKGR